MHANIRGRFTRSAVAAAAILASSCGGKGNPPLPARSHQTHEPPDVAGNDASPSKPTEPSAPRTPSEPGLPDVVFEASGHVDPGSEALGCMYVTMPFDRGPIAVPSAESHYTAGSHHFLVYRTSYDTPPQTGGHACSDAEQVVGVAGSYYEAQTPDERRELPKGVAHVFRPGEVLLLTAHYLNTTTNGIDAHIEFRMHTVDPSEVEHEAGSIFFYNPLISIPPASTLTVTRRCPLGADINVALLWSHMHSRGVAFKATTDDPAAAGRLGDLYSTTTWSEPPPREFPSDPPATLAAGSTIEYSCTFDNTTSQTIVAGQSAATNEMCILHGMYWPRADSATELCSLGTSN